MRWKGGGEEGDMSDECDWEYYGLPANFGKDGDV